MEAVPQSMWVESKRSERMTAFRQCALSTVGFDLSVELAGVGILCNIEIAPTFCVRLLCLALSRGWNINVGDSRNSYL